MAGNFYRTVTEAIADFALHGFDSVERLNLWRTRIRAAAFASLAPAEVVERALRVALTGAYAREVDRGAALKGVPARYTVDRIKPRLRAELDRRIAASADLIKLNRKQAIDKTLQRFSGWATSVPAGGSDAVEKREETKDLRKAISQLPFEERRVATDQGHKLVAAIRDVVATDAGAIAAEWHSNWRQANYDYREDHKERDGQVYLIRDSWAHKAGLVKPGTAGYSTDVTQPGEEVFCRCAFQFVYALRRLPPDMLTAKGRASLDAARAALSA